MKRLAIWLGLVTMVSVSTLAADKKLVLITSYLTQTNSANECLAGCEVLKKCLDTVAGIKVVMYDNRWPDETNAWEGVDALVIYAQGGDANPLLQSNRLETIGKLAGKGLSIGIASSALDVPKDKGGQELMDWIGGYYELQYSCNPVWTAEIQGFPDHAVNRGVKPFAVKDKWCMHMRFRPEMKGVLPILLAKPSDEVRKGPYSQPPGPYPHIVAGSGQEEILMWAVERADGGRGLGFAGGQNVENFGNENYRKLVLNGLVWLCKIDPPPQGIETLISADDLKQAQKKK